MYTSHSVVMFSADIGNSPGHTYLTREFITVIVRCSHANIGKIGFPCGLELFIKCPVNMLSFNVTLFCGRL